MISLFGTLRERVLWEVELSCTIFAVALSSSTYVGSRLKYSDTSGEKRMRQRERERQVKWVGDGGLGEDVREIERVVRKRGGGERGSERAIGRERARA